MKIKVQVRKVAERRKMAEERGREFKETVCKSQVAQSSSNQNNPQQ